MTNFSDPDPRARYDRVVKKRVDEFGMTIDQAQMLVAVLMTDRGKSGEVLLPIKSGEVLPPIKPCPFCGAPASAEEFPSAIGEAAFSVGDLARVDEQLPLHPHRPLRRRRRRRRAGGGGVSRGGVEAGGCGARRVGGWQGGMVKQGGGVGGERPRFQVGVLGLY